MSDIEETEEQMGIDNLGRKRKPKRSPVKFELSPRQEGETIEDWIKRETERLVLKSSICKARREDIVAKDKERADAGIQYGIELNEKRRLQAEKEKALKKLAAEWDAIIEVQHKKMIGRKISRNNRAREHKKELAAYNTLYNRYFRAVSQRVFQNIKSQCGIKHTWADKETKRSIQNGDENQNWKRNARKAVSGMEAMLKNHLKKEGEEE